VKAWDRICGHSIVGTVFLLAILPRAPAQCELGKLVADDAGPRRAFGKSPAISGDVAIIGWPWVSSPDPVVGSAYIFERIGGNWTQVVHLQAGDTIPYDGFGRAVGMTDSVALVGCPHDDVYGGTSGSAYVFRFDAGAWVWEAKLIPDDGDANDWFGESVAIDADTIVVGAPCRGAAYVFERAGDDTWSQVAKLLPSDPPYWEFGLAVALSGDVIVVGSKNDDDHGNWSGSAYVFERSTDGVWQRVAKLFGHDTGGLDEFGTSVAISADTALVGSPGADPQAPGSGAVYVFERKGNGTWLEVAKLFPSDGQNGDRFGSATAVARNTAVIGAPRDDDVAPQAGSAYVFVRGVDGTWSQVSKLVAADGEQEDRFGEVLGLDGNIAVIGVWRDDDHGYNSGSAYVFAVGADEDGNGVMDACECPGDLNHDWIVGHSDLGMFLASWQLDDGGDGDTDHADLGILLANWGNVCP